MYLLAQSRVLPIALMGVALAIGVYLLFFGLGNAPFQDYDEATYAQVTKEALVQEEYVSLNFLQEPYFRKPPLLFWLTSASQSLFEDVEFAVRAPGVLSALLAVAVVMLICWRVSRSYWVAFLGGSILLTTSAFVEPARDVRFDVLISLFIVAAFYAGIRAGHDNRWYIPVGILLGLAVLTKGVIAAFACVAILSYTWLTSRWSFIQNRYVYIGVIAFLFVAGPWHVYMSAVHGFVFWNGYLGQEVFNRVGSNLFAGTNAPTNAQYIGYLGQFAMPWAHAALAACAVLALTCRKLDREIRTVALSAFIASFAVLLVMLASQTKATSYLIPLYPFLAIGVALVVGEAYRLSDTPVRLVLVSTIATLLLVGLYTTHQNALHLNPYYAHELTLAKEEQAIGEYLRQEDNPLVFSYGQEHLGTILYYSELSFTPNRYVYVLSSTSTSTAGAFVLTPHSRERLSAAFPEFSFAAVYIGSLASLFRIER